VRSAVAFGAHGILTLKQRAAPVTPVVVRASAGATEHALIARVTNLATTLSTLADDGYDVIGLAAEGASDLRQLGGRRGSTVLVVGSEGRGLRRLVRERCTALVRIPMAGPIESLNASVAAAIALYALSAPDAAGASDTGARALPVDVRARSDREQGDEGWDDDALAEHEGGAAGRAVWDDDSPFPK